MPSSVIAGFDYDQATAVLTVMFVSGRAYRYFAVPSSEAAGLRRAMSKGAYFNARIRDRYPCQEANPDALEIGERTA